MLPPDCPLTMWLAGRKRLIRGAGRNCERNRLSAKWVLTTPLTFYETRWQRQPRPAIKRTKAVRKEAA